MRPRLGIYWTFELWKARGGMLPIEVDARPFLCVFGRFWMPTLDRSPGGRTLVTQPDFHHQRLVWLHRHPVNSLRRRIVLSQ